MKINDDGEHQIRAAQVTNEDTKGDSRLRFAYNSKSSSEKRVSAKGKTPTQKKSN